MRQTGDSRFVEMYLAKVLSICVVTVVLLEGYSLAKENETCYSAINPSTVDFQMVMDACNSSFSIPMDYLVKFNMTGSLPDETDKTGMCYIRCFFEKTGLIHDWKLNRDLLRQTMWPATGDSIDVCEKMEENESNSCMRVYAIAKCLMTRAIVDARS